MRLGLHYYPDSLHYRQADLERWLPVLQQLGIHWLVVRGDAHRAIPEAFLRGLRAHHIQPVVHIPDLPATPEDWLPLLQAYRRWGVEYVAVGDRPNNRTLWGEQGWAAAGLVDRFLDRYLPLADSLLNAGLRPVFPPLEPGGHYWDTAFLRAALQGIRRRGRHDLLDALVLGAYAWADEHPLDWGRGGPEAWPESRPYRTPPGSQDHRAFRIFEWYAAIAQAATGRPLPILLLGMGHRFPGQPPKADALPHTEANLTIARLLLQQPVDGQPPVPDYVLGGCFWLLTASADSPHVASAWFRPDGTVLPVVDALRTLQPARPIAPKAAPTADHPIAHYLLLPTYDWGVADFHLQVIRPFVQKHRPTIGFSVEEARLAARVTVLGGEREFPPAVLESLRAAGCQVERIQGDGTEIATQLATR